MVKDNHAASATELFADIYTYTYGKWGVPLGSIIFMEEYVNKKVEGCTKEIEKFAEVAVTQPHAAA